MIKGGFYIFVQNLEPGSFIVKTPHTLFIHPLLKYFLENNINKHPTEWNEVTGQGIFHNALY